MTDIKISVLLPTRQRPVLCRRFLDSIVNMSADLSHIEVIIYVDDDDKTIDELDLTGLSTKLLVGHPLTMGGYNSICLNNSSGMIVVLANDDVIIRTKDWDLELIKLHNQIKDGIYLLYPNDLFQGSRLCTFPVMSRKTLNILSDPFPFQYKRAFIDLHLFDVFKRLEKLGNSRCYYLSNLVFEHCHFQNNKSDFDDVYKMREIIKFHDDKEFLNLASLRQECAVKLANAIESGDRFDRSNMSPQVNAGKESPADSDSVTSEAYVTLNSILAVFIDYGVPLFWRIYLVRKFFIRSIVRYMGYNHNWYKLRRWV